MISPDNTPAEMVAKRNLYLEAGAIEVWLCEQSGKMRFFTSAGEIDISGICPDFPEVIES